MPRLRTALLALALCSPAALAATAHSAATLADGAATLPGARTQAPAAPATTPDPLLAWRPALYTDDADQEDRLRFKWLSHGELDEDDTLEIWDTDPAEGADPVLSDRLDGDSLEVMESTADGVRDVRVRTFLGFREFWWSVGTDTDTGDIAWSEVRQVSVVPSPMKKKRVRVNTKFTQGYSTKRPGTIRLRITSSPRARVRVEVKHAGRLHWKKSYIEGVGRLRGFDFKQSCSKQGRFDYVVRMRDPYGTKVTKRGSWTTSPSRCAALRAKEQRKAEEERRRRERQREKERGGDGGSDCVEGYSRCLKPNIGDYDCDGGSGDGPNWVYSPIGVTGSDPFDLDRDGNGTGCENS